MGWREALRDDTRMSNYLFQSHRGHVLVNVEGASFLLDTGTPVSVADAPIRIAGTTFTAESAYLGIDGKILSAQLGVAVDGLIGTDILREFNFAVYAREGIVQFSQLPAAGEIVIPVAEHAGVPVISVQVNGRIHRLLLDTGSALSLLLPTWLQGESAQGTTKGWYPLVGSYSTPFYQLDTVLGSRAQSMQFGQVPELLRGVIVSAGVQGLIGTELLRFYGLNLSLSDRVIRLEAVNKDSYGVTG